MSEQTNPLLARLRIPGSTFRLPSQGIFYQNGELSDDVKNGEVEVYPLTARDEIVLNTPDKLLSGRAITEIFTRCIPQVLKPLDLLAKDVDYLVVCLRMVTYGQHMEIVYQHNCKDALNQTYTVDIQRMISESKSVDPTTVTTEHTVDMPNGQRVQLRPLTYGTVLELNQATMTMKMDEMTEQQAEAMIVDTLAGIIGQVDDTTNPAQIREWLISASLGWKREIEQAAQGVSEWGVDIVTHHVCKDCDQPIAVMININPVSFFT